MDSYKQIYTDWKSWKWVNGTTNCKEEHECEITSSLFTEPVEPLFKPVYTYSIKIYWRIKKFKLLVLFDRERKDDFKERILFTEFPGYKKIKLFSK